MAIEVQVSSVIALVTGEAKEKQIWQGQGDNKKSVGRFVDGEGRPVSTVPAVVIADPLGLLGDAKVQLPDMQAAGLVPGAIIRVEGTTLVTRLTGAEFSVIYATVMGGERVTPIGRWQEWIAQARPAKSGDARAA